MGINDSCGYDMISMTLNTLLSVKGSLHTTIQNYYKKYFYNILKLFLTLCKRRGNNYWKRFVTEPRTCKRKEKSKKMGASLDKKER